MEAVSKFIIHHGSGCRACCQQCGATIVVLSDGGDRGPPLRHIGPAPDLTDQLGEQQ